MGDALHKHSQPGCCSSQSSKVVGERSLWRASQQPMLFWLMGYVIDAAAWRVEGTSFALSYWGGIGLFTALLLRYTNTRLYRRGLLAFLLPLMFVVGSVWVPSVGVSGIVLTWASWISSAAFSAVLISCYVHFPPCSGWRFFFGAVIGVGVVVCTSGVTLLWMPVGAMEIALFAVLSSGAGVAAAWSGWFVCTGGKKFRWVYAQVDDVVSLAVWSAFLYSALQWGMAVLGLSLSGCYFFCDCWKTLGMLGFGRALKAKISEKVQVEDKDLWQRQVLGRSLTAWLRWTPLAVQLSALTASVFWFLQLGGQNFTLPVQVFATMCIAACPCVAVLAEPLALWRNKHIIQERSFDVQTRDSVRAALAQNRVLVAGYYTLSLLASAGGLFWLTGQWMQPWQAGLAMLAGQVVLLINSARPPALEQRMELVVPVTKDRQGRMMHAASLHCCDRSWAKPPGDEVRCVDGDKHNLTPSAHEPDRAEQNVVESHVHKNNTSCCHGKV